MISGRFCWSGLLAGITFMVLGAAEIETGKAEQKPLLPAKQLQSEPVSAKVRALELYMTALRTRNAAERAAILLEILSLDPAAEAPLDQLYDTVNTAAEAHSAAKKLLNSTGCNSTSAPAAMLQNAIHIKKIRMMTSFFYRPARWILPARFPFFPRNKVTVQACVGQGSFRSIRGIVDPHLSLLSP